MANGPGTVRRPFNFGPILPPQSESGFLSGANGIGFHQSRRRIRGDGPPKEHPGARREQMDRPSDGFREGQSNRFRAVSATLFSAACLLPAATGAEAAVGAESQFVLSSFSFLVWGALVMWMCAGFTMLEAGTVRTKNASVICLKNIGAYSIAGLSYYLIGYNLMHTDVGSVIGSPEFLFGMSSDEAALLGGDDAAADAVISTSHASMAHWFFQMVFVATSASIVSGALAERIRLWSFFLFVAVLTCILYPTVGAWTWGGGWLSELGFHDFAGSTVVHSTGGWAALAGVVIIGARTGKFRRDGSVKSTPPSNVPSVTLGVFILWLGWFGFNGGSQAALGSAVDAVSIANILVNTNLAAAAGVLTALAVSHPILGRTDLLASLNGAIGGLVAISASPLFIDHYWAVIVGAVGGLIVVLGIRSLEACRIDDVVGAVPAHLFAGIWGTIAASITGGADVLVQLLGIASVGALVFTASLFVWWAIGRTIGARISLTVEEHGQDSAELGIEAYPEFVLMPEEDVIEAIRESSNRK